MPLVVFPALEGALCLSLLNRTMAVGWVLNLWIANSLGFERPRLQKTIRKQILTLYNDQSPMGFGKAARMLKSLYFTMEKKQIQIS